MPTSSSTTTEIALGDAADAGLLDTCVFIDLLGGEELPFLPAVSMVSAITMAELRYGMAVARDSLEAERRAQIYENARAWLAPLPFEMTAAEHYGDLVALVRATGRSPRPRRLDLMIAATAAASGLVLYTRDHKAFQGIESVVDVRCC